MAIPLWVRHITVKLSNHGYKNSQIKKELEDKYSFSISDSFISKFLKHYVKHGSIKKKTKARVNVKVTTQVLQLIENGLKNNDELTAPELSASIYKNTGIKLSVSTIKRHRRELGWKYGRTRYCALVSDKNKEKRLLFCKKLMDDNDYLQDGIFTDETTVAMESYRAHQFRKRDQPPKLKPKPKHPVKVHVWAGISCKGPTPVCIFEGIMKSPCYVQILDKCLLPNLASHHGDGKYRFIQDNDPKHRSKLASSFIEENKVKYFPTPAQSPDLNPLECVWHEMKEYIRRDCKPQKKEELVEGIKAFWKTVSKRKCAKYISHLYKVIPKVVEVNGRGTGY